MDALRLFEAPSVQDAYWLGRATLCSNRDEFAAYDRCFLALFNGGGSLAVENETERTERRFERGSSPDGKNPDADTTRSSAAASGFSLRAEDSSAGYEDPDTRERRERAPAVGGASAADIDAVQGKDYELLTSAERSDVLAMMRALLSSGPLRPSRRQVLSTSGSIDVRRTVASALSHAGDPERLFRHRRTLRFRRCILLIDVSGSMARYSELLLRLGYALVQARPRSTEVFTIGTRITRLTRLLQIREPTTALSLAPSAVPDWQGGTRLGDQIKAFIDGWGQRGMARGAFLVIASDGWELGDCGVLAAQMQRLRRLAFRIAWCNPHKGTPGYKPTARGICAVLPYIDDFVAGASMNDMLALASLVSRGIGRETSRANLDAWLRLAS